MGNRDAHTLGALMRLNGLLRVSCRRCGRVSRFAAGDLVAFLGAGVAFTAIRFRCSACGARDPAVKGEVDLTDPTLGKVKPRPVSCSAPPPFSYCVG